MRTLHVQSTSSPPQPFQQQDEESCAIWIASSSCPHLKTALILISEIIVLKVKILNIEILEAEFQKSSLEEKATREGQILWKDWSCKAAGSKMPVFKNKNNLSAMVFLQANDIQ